MEKIGKKNKNKRSMKRKARGGERQDKMNEMGAEGNGKVKKEVVNENWV